MAHGIVSTIGQKCKRCYSCVRECPATAIRVLDGQAVVIDERCISCGHCVKVCSQDAKEISSDLNDVLYNLIPTGKTIAIVAPSFAASYENKYKKLPTALRKIGFSKVCETAFGADLISPIYSDYYEKHRGENIISSPCPAIFNYIEKYFEKLVPNLATIVSPMIAMGKYLKKKFGSDYKIVFIGPCVAKKSEIVDEEVLGVIDAVITFVELNKCFESLGIILSKLNDSNFDPPYAHMGKSYPLTGGLLKTSDLPSDVLEKEIIVVDGKEKVEEIIKDISEEKIKSKFIDILFCEGCINGPSIDSTLNYYSKREKVIEFIEGQITQVDKNIWKSEIYNSRDIEFSRNFKANSQRRPSPSEEKINEILSRTNKYSYKDELNCGACGYQTCREYAIAIAKDLAEDDMCLPYLIDKIEKSYIELKATKDQLHSAEKLASIGQLAAGIAHEINNPLGTIMLYSAMLKRGLLNEEQSKQNLEDINTIISEATRCKNIVSNLLNFARQGKLNIEKINIYDLLQDVITKSKIKSINNSIFVNINTKDKNIFLDADKDQLFQVLLNLINNSVEAMEDSELKNLNINLKNEKSRILIDISDTGVGIPKENMSKLFTPFFTTKKIGKGTGLGLAISYGIIKMHKGDIKVDSQINKGTRFTISLPLQNDITKININ